MHGSTCSYLIESILFGNFPYHSSQRGIKGCDAIIRKNTNVIFGLKLGMIFAIVILRMYCMLLVSYDVACPCGRINALTPFVSNVNGSLP